MDILGDLEVQHDLKNVYYKELYEYISIDNSMDLAYGPLNKTNEVKILEDILENNSHDIFYYKEHTYNLCIKHQGLELRMDSLLQKVNFQHVSLDINKFESNIKNTYTELTWEKLWSFKELQEIISQNDKNNVSGLLNLSYIEMLAIRALTTTDGCQTIFSVIRDPNGCDPEQLLNALIYTVVATNALLKLPSITESYVIRRESIERLALYQANVTKHHITTTESFTCTSKHAAPLANLHIIYHNAGEKNIAPLSRYPLEEEHIIPPSTQLKWLGYKILDSEISYKKKHIFAVKAVNFLELIAS